MSPTSLHVSDIVVQICATFQEFESECEEPSGDRIGTESEGPNPKPDRTGGTE